MGRILRVYGRSYSSEDLKGIGQQVCKLDAIQFKSSNIDGYNNALVVVGIKNGNEVSKRISFSHLKTYPLITRAGEQPYCEYSGMIFYRDELEEASEYYAHYNCGKCIKFNVSHKKGCLVVYIMCGIIPNKLEIPLYEVDRFLMKGNNLFKKPYA